MTLELLISTMHQNDYSLLRKMNVCSDAVVINQCDNESETRFDYNGFNIKWINTTERGLSKSRNTALRYATADICMIADDDMIYRCDYAEKVLSAFENTDADIIRFRVEGIEKEFKKYPAAEQKISYLTSMKMASVEISFKRKSFTENAIVFDELIGAGTEFLMGEESALLFDCLKKHLNIRFVPETIADLHIGNSTWRNGYNNEFFIAKGASFAAMRTPFTLLFILQWAFRKSRLYKKEISIGKAVSLMNRGKKEYKRKKKENDT